jgi:hypothetical protein
VTGRPWGQRIGDRYHYDDHGQAAADPQHDPRAAGPAALIGNGSNRTGLTIGYLIGGGVMIIGGLVEVFLGIDAEGKPLEQVARPLTAVGSEGGTP